jgi:uncharacterized protein GlcG (DUF336 family)
MKMISRAVLASLLAAASAGAPAQGVHTRHQLSAALANELVGETVALCASRGYKVWAVVVNLDGVRIAVLRGDGAPIHSQDNAYYKAYTAASLTLGRNENSTKELADRMAKSAPTTVPQTPLPNVTFAQGAIVIRNADKQIIGSIGVSGAPGGGLDEDCARESLAKIQGRIK